VGKDKKPSKVERLQARVAHLEDYTALELERVDRDIDQVLIALSNITLRLVRRISVLEDAAALDRPTAYAPEEEQSVEAAVREAASRAVPVTFVYTDVDNVTSIRHVTPETVEDGSDGALYMIATDHDREAYRAFRLDRIIGQVREAERA